jgi:GT2 family glycosyltransferase
MMRVSVVIPSYRRGAIVASTIEALRSLVPAPDEIILVDQTEQHPKDVEARLTALANAGVFDWRRLDRPSIPGAMNVGLSVAQGDIVLFLDDDIVPDLNLLRSHLSAHAVAGSALVAGMVLQPGQRPEALRSGEGFRFNSTDPANVNEFMGGNFSVQRELALRLGGFDENFVGAAYRFEAEFAHRYVKQYGLISYEPRAIIKHLAIPSGGTRAHGHHLRSLSPAHSVGAYYCFLVTRKSGWLIDLLWRMIRSVRTRHHLRRPWWIPVTLVAEIRGLFWALSLLRQGQRLLPSLRQGPEVISERER